MTKRVILSGPVSLTSQTVGVVKCIGAAVKLVGLLQAARSRLICATKVAKKTRNLKKKHG
jgi:hypothetical protein